MHRLFGVNLSGAEFAPWNGQTFPTNADFAYLASKGVGFVRLPVAWEQLQPTLLGSLATTYLNSIKTAIDNGYANGIGVMVDLHNFGAYAASAQWTTTVAYAGNVGVPATGVSFLGDGTLTSAAFVDVWTKLSTALAGRAGLAGYGVMNEPVRSVGTNQMPAPNYFSPATGLNSWFSVNSMSAAVLGVGTNPLGAGYGPAWSLTAGSAFAAMLQSVTLTNVPWTVSVYARVAAGTSTGRFYLGGSNSAFTATTTWTRYSFTATPSAGAANVGPGIDTSGQTIQFANFQAEIAGSATAYAPSPYIPFAQAAVTAIRAVDATTPIHVCGGISFSAASWKMFNYEMALMTGGGLIFEAHQYFDGPQGVGGGGGYSGTYTSYGIDDQSGVQTLTPFTGWATDNGKSIYIGEFSVPNRTTDNDAAWLPLQVNFLNTLYAANIKASMWFYGSNGVQPSNILNVVPVAGVNDPRLTQMLAVGASPVGGARVLQRFNKSKLAYPAGSLPGFDPSHPAAQSISGGQGISAVAINGNLVDLTAGVIGAKTGTSTTGVKSSLGPSVNITGSSDSFDFTGKLTVTSPPATTIAAIVQFSSIAGGFQCIFEANASAGNALFALSGGVLTLYNGTSGNQNDSSFTLVADTPYFLAVSTTGGVFNFAVLNLRTGSLKTSQNAGVSLNTLGPTYKIGNHAGFQPMLGAMAAVMYAPTFLKMPELVAFAADPWSFWYPNKPINLTSDTAVVTPPVTTGGARVSQRFNRSKLAYPAGALPGIDRTHPAAQNIFISMVAQGGSSGAVNLLTGAPPDSGSTPASKINSWGPAVVATSSSSYVLWSNGTPASGTRIAATLGIIFAASSTVSFIGICDIDNGASLGTDGSGNLILKSSGTTSNSGILLSFATPYFIAASYSQVAGNVNFIVKNLLTGAVQSSSVSLSTVAIPLTGRFAVGTGSGIGFLNSTFGVSAGMAGATYLSPRQLQQWALDPWSFWYPNKPLNLTSTAAVASTATGGARVLQRFNRSKLAYPAGSLPGFDPSHVASKNMRPGRGLSAVARPGLAGITDGRMFNLLKGRPCTNAGANVTNSGINGSIGPGVNVLPATATNPITDSGNAAVVDAGQTLAAIFFYKSGQTDNPVLVGSGSVYTNSWYLYVNGPTGEVTTYTSAGISSGIVLNNNEAYFVAASNVDGLSNVYIVVKSLKTGKVQTATTAAVPQQSTANPSSGTYTIGGDTFGNQCTFPIAAVSYTPAALSMAQLLAWSTDPWSFWYPNKPLNLTSDGGVIVAPPTFLAAWARQSNLPVLGTGNF